MTPQLLRGIRGVAYVMAASGLVACAALLGLPDPSLDEYGTDGKPRPPPSDDARSADGPAADAPDAAATTACNPDAPFTSPVPFGTLASDLHIEEGATAAGDGVFFRRSNMEGLDQQIFYASLSVDGGPGEPRAVPISGLALAATPALTDDYLTLFVNGRASVFGRSRLWRATRPNTSALAFGDAGELDLEVEGGIASDPRVNQDELWYSVLTPLNGSDLYRAAIYNNSGGFGKPVSVASLNTPANEGFAVVTGDGKRVYFGTDRVAPGTQGFDIWTATRPSRAASFSTPTPVSELNSAGFDAPNWVSPDGCWMLLETDRDRLANGSPNMNIYVARRRPR